MKSPFGKRGASWDVETTAISPRLEATVPPQRSESAQLVVLVGPSLGRRFLVSDEGIIGREADCQVQLSDDTVSRHHSRIRRGPSGYILEDLGSRNGTYLNGVRVEHASIRFGDSIGVGQDTVLLFAEYDHFHDQLVQAQKLQALGQLAGGVAHDFNNLLGVTLAGITHVQQLVPDDPEIKGTLEEIEAAVRRATDLIGQLLAFTRRGTRERKPSAVSDLLEEIQRLVHRTKPANIELTMECAPNLGLLGDASQIMQVLMNLSINAIDAMPEGGRLSFKAVPAPEAKLAGRGRPSTGPRVIITVSDTGTGMSDEVRKKIFEPFFTTKAPGKGTGIGLATVFRIVQDHGGTIDVESRLGHGTTFHVALPAAEVPTTAAARWTGTKSLPQRVTGTVLLVDDEEPILYVARKVLERAGATVLATSDPSDATRIYLENLGKIDLSILDLSMPKMSGDQLFEAVRRIDPQAKVIISSGNANDSTVERLTALGVHGFLPKPYNSRELVAAVATGLERSANTPPPSAEASSSEPLRATVKTA